MKLPDYEALGDPSLDLFGLKLWIHGRQFPNANDFWDGNWLRVTAMLSTSTSVVRTEGPEVSYVSLQGLTLFLPHDAAPQLVRANRRAS
jgi:hypothetical protein